MIVVDPVEDDRRPLRVKSIDLCRIDRSCGVREIFHRHGLRSVDDEYFSCPEVAVPDQAIDVVKGQQIAEVAGVPPIDVERLCLEVAFEERGWRNRID